MTYTLGVGLRDKLSAHSAAYAVLGYELGFESLDNGNRSGASADYLMVNFGVMYGAL